MGGCDLSYEQVSMGVCAFTMGSALLFAFVQAMEEEYAFAASTVVSFIVVSGLVFFACMKKRPMFLLCAMIIQFVDFIDAIYETIVLFIMKEQDEKKEYPELIAEFGAYTIFLAIMLVAFVSYGITLKHLLKRQS